VIPRLQGLIFVIKYVNFIRIVAFRRFIIAGFSPRIQQELVVKSVLRAESYLFFFAWGYFIEKPCPKRPCRMISPENKKPLLTGAFLHV
jgi:hypothetical protein